MATTGRRPVRTNRCHSTGLIGRRNHGSSDNHRRDRCDRNYRRHQLRSGPLLLGYLRLPTVQPQDHYGFRSSAVCLSQWACTVIPFTAMPGPQPSARAAADPRTMRLALELLERTAGRRRRCRRCRSVIAGNARKRGQAWSVCTPCARAVEDDAHQLEIEPAFIRRCLVCRTDIVHLRAGARTCGGACRNVLLRLLRNRRRSIP